jgi:hypothetical protein
MCLKTERARLGAKPFPNQARPIPPLCSDPRGVISGEETAEVSPGDFLLQAEKQERLRWGERSPN